MAKPPKQVSGMTSPDTPSKTSPPLPKTPEDNRLNIDKAGPWFAGATQTSAPFSQGSPSDPLRQPSVLVSEMPRTVPGPFLNKSERQPTWPFERPDWLMQESGHETPSHFVVDPAPAEASIYLDPADAARLSPALNTPNGIRFDKHRKTYVDTPDGTVMVRKNAAGEYQLAFATATDSSAIQFEQIPGTRLWRRRTWDTAPVQASSQQQKRRATSDLPDPNKPQHLEDAPHTAQTLSESLLSAHPKALNLPYGLWRGWGKSSQPPLGQHIEIEGLHYHIVPQVLSDDSRLAYLQHPLFSPALYDAFEHMLRDNPSLQPKWTVKRNDRWTVLDRRFAFEMPITQYICRTFSYLSDQSVSSLARAMFNQANRSEIISGEGLAVLNQTFRYWADRHFQRSPRSDLADPLLMLCDVGGGLQRLDLDPGRFPQYWNEYAAAPAIPKLRNLFREVLADDGYIINSPLHASNEDTLLFHRETLDVVFVLKIPPVINGRLQRTALPDSVLTDSVLQTLIDPQQRPPHSYKNTNNIVYLLGGIQTDALDQPSLFIIKKH